MLNLFFRVTAQCKEGATPLLTVLTIEELN